MKGLENKLIQIAILPIREPLNYRPEFSEMICVTWTSVQNKVTKWQFFYFDDFFTGICMGIQVNIFIYKISTLVFTVSNYL